ncbi:hypothetical protein MD484_g8805, partial [Candolleomyces efflorescens]
MQTSLFRDDIVTIREKISELSSRILNQQIAGTPADDVSGIRRDLSELAVGLDETDRLIRRDPARTRQGTAGQLPPACNASSQTPPAQSPAADRNALAPAVRRFFAALLSPVPPTSEQTRTWDSQSGPVCTVTNFQPDFNSPYNVPRNRSAQAVFIQTFLASNLPEAVGADPNQPGAEHSYHKGIGGETSNNGSVIETSTAARGGSIQRSKLSQFYPPLIFLLPSL